MNFMAVRETFQNETHREKRQEIMENQLAVGQFQVV